MFKITIFIYIYRGSVPAVYYSRSVYIKGQNMSKALYNFFELEFGGSSQVCPNLFKEMSIFREKNASQKIKQACKRLKNGIKICKTFYCSLSLNNDIGDNGKKYIRICKYTVLIIFIYFFEIILTVDWDLKFKQLIIFCGKNLLETFIPKHSLNA